MTTDGIRALAGIIKVRISLCSYNSGKDLFMRARCIGLGSKPNDGPSV